MLGSGLVGPRLGVWLRIPKTLLSISLTVVTLEVSLAFLVCGRSLHGWPQLRPWSFSFIVVTKAHLVMLSVNPLLGLATGRCLNRVSRALVAWYLLVLKVAHAGLATRPSSLSRGLNGPPGVIEVLEACLREVWTGRSMLHMVIGPRRGCARIVSWVQRLSVLISVLSHPKRTR